MKFAEFQRKSQLLALQDGNLSESERLWLTGVLRHPTMQKALGHVLIECAGMASQIAAMPLWGEESLAKARKLQGISEGYVQALEQLFGMAELESENERSADDKYAGDSDGSDADSDGDLPPT